MAAWDRAIDILRPIWPDRDMGWDGPRLAEGAAGLATGIYLVARRDGRDVRDVHRADIESLVGPRPEFGYRRFAADWERQLVEFGHDLNDPADPVTETWRMLARDRTPTPEQSRAIPDAVWEDSTMMAWGISVEDNLPRVLAPHWELTF
ncbi:hypothetical protein ACFYNO_14810 [Kitasatospora sp. NPDC006697]|uniref:hypothetical protein n=1 Tax=unclassified Kitasatospora TaxID=2633591 RepID=UPI003678C8C5